MFPFRIRWPEHANEEIPLGEAEANLGINGKTLARTFNVLLQLLPVPHVEFRGQFPRPDLNIGDIQNAGDCELLLENDPTPVRITRLSFSRTDIDLTLSPRHERAYIGIKEPAEQIRCCTVQFPRCVDQGGWIDGG
ncbi:MAG TPA: hypothetical protein VH325_13495 [Bryobacteraceae bacterium]|nr:hypothetical protein [Bryobacteraceae bacterium]